MDVPFTDVRFRRMRFSTEADDRLLAAFDAGLFHHDWSGTIEFRFRTPQAPAFLNLLREPAASPAAVPGVSPPQEPAAGPGPTTGRA